MYITLFSKRSAHWFTPVLPVTLGHWPWPRVMSILSNGLDSNMQKLLSRPIDKIKMTRGWGRWPRDLRKLGWFSCALLLEKSVHFSTVRGHWCTLWPVATPSFTNVDTTLFWTLFARPIGVNICAEVLHVVGCPQGEVLLYINSLGWHSW